MTGELLAIPCGVLLFSDQHGDGLHQLGVARQRPAGVGIDPQNVASVMASAWSDSERATVWRSR